MVFIADKILLEKFIFAGRVIKSMKGLVQFLPYAGTQVLGGSFSICDDQYLLYGQILFENQAEYQPADGKGFTCTRTCVYEVNTRKRAVDKVKGVRLGGLAGVSGHNRLIYTVMVVIRHHFKINYQTTVI